MGRTKIARTNPVAGRRPAARRRPGIELHRIPSRGKWASDIETLGLRERKKARLRQEIIDTAVRLFRKRGYEKTRIDDIVQSLEISQPTFFRYFPSKDAVLGEVGRRGFACITEHLKNELSSEATTDEQGQKRGEVSRAFPVEHLAEFMDGLYNTTVRQWAVDLTGPHKLSDRVSSAVAFFLRGVRP